MSLNKYKCLECNEEFETTEELTEDEQLCDDCAEFEFESDIDDEDFENEDEYEDAEEDSENE